MIKFNCENCKESLYVDETANNDKAQCPFCENSIIISLDENLLDYPKSGFIYITLLIFTWIIFTIMILFTLMNLIAVGLISSIPLMLLSIFICPSTHKYMRENFGKILSNNRILVIIISLLILYPLSLNFDIKDNRYNQVVKHDESIIATSNKEKKSTPLEVVPNLKAFIYNKKYKEAIEYGKKYKGLGDSDVNKLIVNADKFRLLESASTTKSTDYLELKNIYMELLNYEPKNPEYRKRYMYYKKKIDTSQKQD